jgi:broad-specificity NMP kinase
MDMKVDAHENRKRGDARVFVLSRMHGVMNLTDVVVVSETRVVGLIDRLNDRASNRIQEAQLADYK